MGLAFCLSRTWRRHHSLLMLGSFFLLLGVVCIAMQVRFKGLQDHFLPSRKKITHTAERKPQFTPEARPKDQYHFDLDTLDQWDYEAQKENLMDYADQSLEKYDEELACKVPIISLKDDALKQYFYKIKKFLFCNESRLFQLVDHVLRMDTTVLGTHRLDYCDYRAIDRISDQIFTYSNSKRRSSDFELTVNHDFFKVDCFLQNNFNATTKGKNGEVMRTMDKNMTAIQKVDNITFDPRGDYKSRGWGSRILDFVNSYRKKPDFQQIFAQVQPRKDVFQRIANLKPPSNSSRMNVLILGIDSMSHMSYQRTLPLTYNYLKHQMDAVILNSYNVVGDGTTGAYIPLLTGHKEDELPNIRWGPLSLYADAYPIIWNKFKSSGYVTLYGEDYPLIDTFNNALNGFNEAPVDHYMRPFWQAAFDSDELKKNGAAPCLNGRPRHQYMFDYLKDFFDVYRMVPKFALEHFTALSSADPNAVQYMDADLKDFLEWMKIHGHLDQTLVIIMSDHGSRFSSIQQTTQGKLEERLPMMSLTLPAKFQEKYPRMVASLKRNADRLTTAFDVHETLRTVLNINLAEDGEAVGGSSQDLRRGISLFKDIPASRTCVEAGISLHWCSCLEYLMLNPDDTSVRDLGYFLVRQINNKTNITREQCIELHLQRVVEARLLTPNKEILDITPTLDMDMAVAHYQLTIETTPNDGVYEAIIRGFVNDNTAKVLGGISRINKFREESKCLSGKNPRLRKYCFCRP